MTPVTEVPLPPITCRVPGAGAVSSMRMRIPQRLVMSLRTKVQTNSWETRAWDVITVAVMLVSAFAFALWTVHR